MHFTPLELVVITSTVLEFNPLLQVIKSIRLKKTDELSVGTFCLILVIGSLWFYYGFTIQNVPLIIGNAIKIFSCLAVIVVYFKYKD